MWYAKKKKLTAWWPQAPSVGPNPKPLIGNVDVSTEWEDTSNIIPRGQIYARHPFNHTCSWYLLTPSETLGLAFGNPLFCWFWKETPLSVTKKQKKNDSRITEPLPIHWLQCPVINILMSKLLQYLISMINICTAEDQNFSSGLVIAFCCVMERCASFLTVWEMK